MHKDLSKFLTVSRRVLACVWALVGFYILFLSLSQYEWFNFWAMVQLTLGTGFVIGALGLLLDKRWGRVCIGCLMALVVLFCADMLLFIAFRGLGAGRVTLLGLVVALVATSVCTWSFLAATRRQFQRPIH